MTTKSFDGGPKYSKHFLKEPIRVPVLAVKALDAKEIENMKAAHKPLTTGVEAQQFVQQHLYRVRQEHDAGHEAKIVWAYTLLDQRGRVGVLSYNGTEVALFFQRQVLMIEPQANEPIPENSLKEVSDVWVKLDLLGPSARQANLFLVKQHSELAGLVAVLKQQITGLESQLSHVETQRTKLEGRLERREAQVLVLQERLAPTKKKSKKKSKSKPKRRK